MKAEKNRIIIYLLLCLTLVACGQGNPLGNHTIKETTVDLNKLQINNLMTLAGESKRFKIEELDLPPLPKGYRLQEAVANDDFIYGIMEKTDEESSKFNLLQVSRRTGRQRYLIFHNDKDKLLEAGHLEMSSLGPVFRSKGEKKSTIYLLNEGRGKFERLVEVDGSRDLTISSDDRYIAYLDQSKANELWLCDLEERDPELLTEDFNPKLGMAYINGPYLFYGDEESLQIYNRISRDKLELKMQSLENLEMVQGNGDYLMGVLQNQDVPDILIYPFKTAQPELYQSKDLLKIDGALPGEGSLLIQSEKWIYVMDPTNYTLQKLYGLKAGEEIIEAKKNHLGNYQVLVEDSEGRLRFVEFIESIREN